jgi:hypothetical protein
MHYRAIQSNSDKADRLGELHGPGWHLVARTGPSPVGPDHAQNGQIDVANLSDCANAALQNKNLRERNMPDSHNRHRNRDGEISHKHGNTQIGTLRKIYGRGFAAGYPETEKLSAVLGVLNETSLSQLRRDHETGHLEHKLAVASK